LQKRVDELDAENQGLRGNFSEKLTVTEKKDSNAHLLNVPVSGGTSLVRESAPNSANALAGGDSEVHILSRGGTTRIVSAAASATGGAGSSCASAASAKESFAKDLSSSTTAGQRSTVTYKDGIKTTHIFAAEPARIIRADVKPQKHATENKEITEIDTLSAKTADNCEKSKLHMHRTSLNHDSTITEEDLTITTTEKEVPQKHEIKTKDHVNYIPMGRPKAHERLSPTPSALVVDHLDNHLEKKQARLSLSSSPLHKELGFPLPESMTHIPDGMGADESRVQTFERDLELSRQEHLLRGQNAIVDGVLNAATGQEASFEESLEIEQIIHHQ